eukprot:2506721-Rhodomonas_salina.2
MLPNRALCTAMVIGHALCGGFEQASPFGTPSSGTMMPHSRPISTTNGVCAGIGSSDLAEVYATSAPDISSRTRRTEVGLLPDGVDQQAGVLVPAGGRDRVDGQGLDGLVRLAFEVGEVERDGIASLQLHERAQRQRERRGLAGSRIGESEPGRHRKRADRLHIGDRPCQQPLPADDPLGERTTPSAPDIAERGHRKEPRK